MNQTRLGYLLGASGSVLNGCPVPQCQVTMSMIAIVLEVLDDHPPTGLDPGNDVQHFPFRHPSRSRLLSATLENWTVPPFEK